MLLNLSEPVFKKKDVNDKTNLEIVVSAKRPALPWYLVGLYRCHFPSFPPKPHVFQAHKAGGGEGIFGMRPQAAPIPLQCSLSLRPVGGPLPPPLPGRSCLLPLPPSQGVAPWGWERGKWTPGCRCSELREG